MYYVPNGERKDAAVKFRTKPDTPITEQISALTFDNRWSSGLCSCCTDMKSCCLSCWCWPCFTCCLDSASKECACTTFCIAFLTGGSPFGIAINRTRIRSFYKINGSVLEDCCLSFCCTCCVGTQLWRELKFRGEIKK